MVKGIRIMEPISYIKGYATYELRTKWLDLELELEEIKETMPETPQDVIELQQSELQVKDEMRAIELELKDRGTMGMDEWVREQIEG
jgi:hypothetical protein